MGKHRLFHFELTGSFVKKNWKTYVFLLSLIAVFELFMFVRGLMVFDLKSTRRVLYMESYVVLFLGSLSVIPFILKCRNNTITLKGLSITLHVYAFFIFAWSLLISYLDMQKGGYPIVFLTIAVTIGGVVVINPVLFTAFSVLGTIIIFLVNGTLPTPVFTSLGTYFNVVVFLAMSLIITYRQYLLLRNEAKARAFLEKLSYKDTLTGLGNETAYFSYIDELQGRMDKGDAEYAFMVLDVNNVKTTNDKYGHRFGCHLIVETGKRLPSFFSSSTLYHIGGDEFVVILEGRDYQDRHEIREKLSSSLSYSEIDYEGVRLILSVASGLAECSGEHKTYSEVFHLADKAMYLNKMEIKAKYNLSLR